MRCTPLIESCSLLGQPGASPFFCLGLPFRAYRFPARLLARLYYIDWRECIDFCKTHRALNIRG
jgi:hypothetical protein